MIFREFLSSVSGSQKISRLGVGVTIYVKEEGRGSVSNLLFSSVYYPSHNCAWSSFCLTVPKNEKSSIFWPLWGRVSPLERRKGKGRVGGTSLLLEISTHLTLFSHSFIHKIP